MYNQLPFRTDVLQSQQTVYNTNNPPVMFNLLSTAEFQNVIPAVIAILANDITNQATASAIRCFTYNQMSRNNWNNNDFAEACQFAVGLSQLNMYKRITNNIEQAVNQACMITSAAYTSINITKFPVLKQYIPVELVSTALQNIQEFNGTMNEISNMFNNGGNMQTNNAYQPMNRQFQPANNQPYRNNFGSSFAVNTGANNNVISNNVVNDRYAERNNNISKLQPVVETPPMATQYYKDQPPQISKKDWVATTVQPYRTLFNIKKYFAVYDEQYINGNKFVIETIRENEMGMDKNSHVVGYLPGAINQVNATKTLSELDMPPAINKVINATVTDRSTENTDAIVKSDIWTQETNLDDAIFTARKWLFKIGSTPIFTCNAFIATPYLLTRESNKLFSELENSATFSEIAVCIDKAIKAEVPEAIILNNQMTELVNNILCNRLSLETNIDSFVEDLSSLVTHISKKYGGMWLNAWDTVENEVVIVNDLFPKQSDNNENELTSILADTELDDGGVKAENIYIHTKRVSISLIDILSKDLNYNLSKNESLLISPDVSPSLFRLAEHLLGSNEDSIQMNVLVTKDNVKYQLSKGAMVKNSYLISLL